MSGVDHSVGGSNAQLVFLPCGSATWSVAGLVGLSRTDRGQVICNKGFNPFAAHEPEAHGQTIPRASVQLRVHETLTTLGQCLIALQNMDTTTGLRGLTKV